MDQAKQSAFAERVRIRLAAMGQSQSDLARSYGVTRQNMSKIIRRGPYLNYQSLERLADMLAVSVAWLVDGDPRDGVANRDQLPEDEA